MGIREKLFTNGGSEYSKDHTGDHTVFNVKPFDNNAFSWVYLGFVLILLWWFLAAFTVFIFANIVVGIGIAVVLFKEVIPFYRYSRKPSSVSVSNKEIVINGSNINCADVSRLVLRNHLSGDGDVVVPRTDLIAVYGGTGAVGYSMAAGAAIAGAASNVIRGATRAVEQNQKKYRERYSWRLDVEANGKATTIAAGLDESTAYGLMSDIGRIVGAAA